MFLLFRSLFCDAALNLVRAEMRFVIFCGDFFSDRKQADSADRAKVTDFVHKTSTSALPDVRRAKYTFSSSASLLAASTANAELII
jgi:hypothetical protein